MPETVLRTLSLPHMRWLFPYFMLGRFIKQCNLHEKVFKNSYLFIASFAIWLFLKPDLFKGTSCLIGCSAIIVVIHLCKAIAAETSSGCSMAKKILLYIGKNTLYIYVFHYFFLEIGITTYFIDSLCQYSNMLMDIIVCIVPTCLIVALSLAVKVLVEHNLLIMNYIFNKK